jgi:Helix-turn-helix domain
MRREPTIDRREAGRLDDAYLPLKALAGYSGLSVRTLRTYLVHASTPLPHFRIGGKVLVRRSEFDAWAARFRVERQPIVENLVNEVLADLQVR